MSPLLAAVALAASAAQAPPVFRAEAAVVRVEALVTHGGSPVRGLRAGDFELRDDGRLQTLEPILEEETPVDAVLVLDTSASVIGTKLVALQAAARAFLGGLRAGERAALLTFHHEVRLLEPLTADLGAVRRSLDRATATGSTALADALYCALRLLEPGDRRTALVVFSDGLDNTSWLPPEDVVEAARRSNAIVYGVAARARGDEANPFLADVVRATGGRLFEATSERELRARFLDVLGDIRARYVLRYAPSGADRAGWHALEVRLKGRRGDVLARPGYWRAGP